MEHGDALLLGVLRGPLRVILGVLEAVAAVRAGPHALLGPPMTMVVVAMMVTVMVVGVVMAVVAMGMGVMGMMRGDEAHEDGHGGDPGGNCGGDDAAAADDDDHDHDKDDDDDDEDDYEEDDDEEDGDRFDDGEGSFSPSHTHAHLYVRLSTAVKMTATRIATIASVDGTRGQTIVCSGGHAPSLRQLRAIGLLQHAASFASEWARFKVNGVGGRGGARGLLLILHT